MIASHLSIHNVAGITIERERTANGAKWFSLIVTDEAGIQTELTLFFRSKQPEINGAELLNLMQAVEE